MTQIARCSILLSLLLTVPSQAIDLGERTTVVWVTQEWSFSGVPFEGNPFDLDATVRFVHEETGAVHETPLFYTEGDTWKYRFTPTFRGVWRFRFHSRYPALNGHTGVVRVNKNALARPRGFLTHVGQRIGEMIQDARDLRGYEFNVFMDQTAYSPRLDAFGDDPDAAAKKAVAYLEHAKRNGFEIIFISVYHNWLKFGALRHNEHDSVDPDLTSFRVLEAIIEAVHQAGGRVHLWAWGDESRKQTPKGLPDGINGEVDRRLQRYIAGRLGPLPGWTMGYGFDLHEWTNEAQVNAWADALNAWSGWPHLLAARGLELNGWHTFRSYGSFGREGLVETSTGGPLDFDELRAMMASDRGRPHLLEERHTYSRKGFDLDMDGTRRLLWRKSMVGGVGGFFGFYGESSSAFQGRPYPDVEQLNTHHEFWHERASMLYAVVDTNIIDADVAPGYALRNRDRTKHIFYLENTGRMSADLTLMKGRHKVFAIDTKRPYERVIYTTWQPGIHVFPTPYVSHWAIAVGF